MRYQISPEALFSKIDDEVIIMSIENDSYYGLDPIGSTIWELLEKPATIDELVGQLTAEYDVTADQCRIDVQAFLDDMISRNLIQAIAE